MEQFEMTVQVGEEYDYETFVSRLVEFGYNYSEMVSTPGEMSRRGGIVDIYPLTEDFPIRIEWFDDEIESIRYFDGETQRSKEELDRVTISPAEEYLLTKKELQEAGNKLEKLLEKSLKERSEERRVGKDYKGNKCARS